MHVPCLQYHQRRKKNQDLLKEFKVYEVGIYFIVMATYIITMATEPHSLNLSLSCQEMIGQVYSVEYELPEPGTPG